jgi:hypothetical protein
MFEMFERLNGFQLILLTILVGVTGGSVAEIVRAFFRHREPPKRSQEFERRLDDRLKHLEQSMEAMALDIERIAEAQRFAARLLADSGAPAAGAALPREPRGAGRARNQEGAHVGG